MSNFRVIWVVRGLILLNASAAIGIVKILWRYIYEKRESKANS